MLEMALAGFLFTIALVAIGGRAGMTSGTSTLPLTGLFEEGLDLPCPWCRGNTAEGDDHCTSCGQRFG